MVDINGKLFEKPSKLHKLMVQIYDHEL